MAWLGVVVGLLLIALTAFLMNDDIPPWVLIMNTVLAVVIPVALIVASSIRVTVTSECFAVRWGPVGWPTRSIRWSDVTAVSVITVDPWDWGGWGYRWAPGGRGAAAVVRGGPAIQLDLASGKRFTVTVDDAAEGVTACLRALSAGRA